jgi:hypothetical protein
MAQLSFMNQKDTIQSNLYFYPAANALAAGWNAHVSGRLDACMKLKCMNKIVL